MSVHSPTIDELIASSTQVCSVDSGCVVAQHFEDNEEHCKERTQNAVKHINRCFKVQFDTMMKHGPDHSTMWKILDVACNACQNLIGEDVEGRSEYMKRITPLFRATFKENIPSTFKENIPEIDNLIDFLSEKYFTYHFVKPKLIHSTLKSNDNIRTVTLYIDAFGTMGMNNYCTFVVETKQFNIQSRFDHPIKSTKEQVEKKHMELAL